MKPGTVSIIIIFFLSSILNAQTAGWHQQTSPTLHNLYGICFSNNIAIAVGEGGTIIRSTDSGITWKEVSSPVTDALRSVSFNGDTGLAAGISGRIIRSTDAGANWSEESRQTTKDLYSISMDSRMAVITGHEGTILVSTDNGVTWKSHTAGTASNLFGVSVFADSAIAVGGQAAAINSVNRGSGWGLSILGPTQQLFFYAASLVNGRTGWAVGAYQVTGSIIIRTDSYGFTWSAQTTPTTNTLFGVSFSNIDTGTAVGMNGTIIHTTNGGDLWIVQSSNVIRTLNAVSFKDPKFGIAVGDSGTILLTEDGGGVTAIDESANSIRGIPESFALEQNYPNPFNPSTNIEYSIGSEEFVSLKVYDLLGNQVADLVNEEKPAGKYNVVFSAKGGSVSGGNANGLSSGIYFYRLKAGKYLFTKKLILLK